jgi:uncharacterized protein
MGDKRHQDNLSPEERKEIGKKGGEATAEKHGPEFYQEIGHKGGSNPENPGRFDNRDDEEVKEAARKGGES